MIRLPLACSLTLLLAGSSALATFAGAADTAAEIKTAAASSTLNKDDAEFVRMALLGGKTLVQTSELAIKRAILTGADLEFAKKIVSDHNTVNDELTALARTKNLVLPTGLDEKMQKKVDDLGKKSDKDLREAYLECQVDAHKKAVSAFKSASDDAKDGDVKAFAAKHLPHFQQHLETVKTLEKNS